MIGLVASVVLGQAVMIECKVDSDCGSDARCEKSRCVASAKAEQFFCKGDADCQSGQSCERGYCQTSTTRQPRPTQPPTKAPTEAPTEAPTKACGDLPTLHFASGGVAIVDGAVLKSALRCVKASGRILVTAHCDVRGSDSLNDALSLRRAKQVVALLGRYGISATAAGKGKSEPVCEESTTACHAMNRRAVLSAQ